MNKRRHLKQGARPSLVGFSLFPQLPSLLLVLSAVTFLGCGQTLADRAMSTLDAIQDTTLPIRQTIVMSCHGAEWSIVGRLSTELDDKTDLSKIRTECDRLFDLWDAWAAMDGIVRQTVQAGSPQAALNLLPALRKAVQELHEAVRASPILKGD